MTAEEKRRRAVIASRKYRLKNKGTKELAARRRSDNLKKHYGITVSKFDDMLTAQNNACAICGTTTPQGPGKIFHVDHCHKTQRIRGLLCHHCNCGIGNLKDSPEIIKAALQYLEA